IMNEIESEFDGVVKEILAQNSHPVEYGQVLFRIDRKWVADSRSRNGGGRIELRLSRRSAADAGRECVRPSPESGMCADTQSRRSSQDSQHAAASLRRHEGAFGSDNAAQAAQGIRRGKGSRLCTRRSRNRQVQS